MQNYAENMCCALFLFLEKLFWGKSGQKNQNCQFKRKFGTKNNLNMRNAMMMFNIFLAEIWSKNSKLFGQSEI